MRSLKNITLWISLSVLLLLYLIVLLLTPKPIDWGLSYSGEDSVPYGCKIVCDETEKLFSLGTFKINKKPIYNWRGEGKESYIFINKEFAPDDVDLESLLEKVKDGSNVFIAASSFSENIQDALLFKYDEEFILNKASDSLRLNFVNPHLKTDSSYIYEKAFQKVYFTEIDTASSIILSKNGSAKTCFIKVKYGRGNFLINLNPLAFTNYNILNKNNFEYAFKSLSYLKGNHIVWDEYYKEKPRPSTSAVRYILSQEALRYAWYLTLIGLLLYLVFGAKRKQRVIPIFNPPTNTTISFITTIGALYYKGKNHKDIARKKYKYFLEFLRSKYYIDTNLEENLLIKEISQKLNVPDKVLKKMFSQVQRLNMDSSYNEEDLEQFTKNIDFIYQNCK